MGRELGHKVSIKTREKIRKSLTGIVVSEETKKKMRESSNHIKTWLGHKFSEETKKKMSLSAKGKIGYWLGKRRGSWSEETKLKMSLAAKGKIHSWQLGEKNHFWQGGKSFELYPIDWTDKLKITIRERDKYTCQICIEYGSAVHHIDYNKNNCNPENLITLCHSCHCKTNFNRKKWIDYFS